MCRMDTAQRAGPLVTQSDEMLEERRPDLAGAKEGRTRHGANYHALSPPSTNRL